LVAVLAAGGVWVVVVVVVGWLVCGVVCGVR
jgi:hypothetical protein